MWPHTVEFADGSSVEVAQVCEQTSSSLQLLVAIFLLNETRSFAKTYSGRTRSFGKTGSGLA